MAAPKKHPLFLELTQSLSGIKGADVTFQDVFNNTGPNMLHRFLASLNDKYAFKVIGLESICPAGILSQLGEGYSIEQPKSLSLIHHNTESWNVQHPCPKPVPPGYTLFVDQDVLGGDIAYVAGDVSELIEKANENVNAVAFNYNGYLKEAGARLSPMSKSSSWLKEGCQAWVCVKNEFVEQVS
jgi:hypothetical protein